MHHLARIVHGRLELHRQCDQSKRRAIKRTPASLASVFSTTCVASMHPPWEDLHVVVILSFESIPSLRAHEERLSLDHVRTPFSSCDPQSTSRHLWLESESYSSHRCHEHCWDKKHGS